MQHEPAITILVVEDEPFVRMDISDALVAAGITVLEAGNADDAIRLLESHPKIQALFTDIDMPGSMNGLMLATAVRDRWPPIQILITSGHRYICDVDLPVEGHFFSKPYDPSQVVKTMRNMVHG
jgi:CheY-like chemotaxis protein